VADAPDQKVTTFALDPTCETVVDLDALAATVDSDGRAAG
jgi:hypothetical protein